MINEPEMIPLQPPRRRARKKGDGANRGRTPPRRARGEVDDFIDRVIDYVRAHVEQLTEDDAIAVSDAVRREYGGGMVYVAKNPGRERIARRILRLFNGRNATEVARKIGCSRATVYRALKQAGREKDSQI